VEVRLARRLSSAGPPSGAPWDGIIPGKNYRLARGVCPRSSRPAVHNRYCSTVASSAPKRAADGQGLVRKRRMFPWLIAEMAASISALPLNKTRTVSGAVRRIRYTRETPSIPCIRKSDTTTANGPLETTSRIASLASPVAVASKRLRNWRCRASSTGTPSST